MIILRNYKKHIQVNFLKSLLNESKLKLIKTMDKVSNIIR